MIKKTVLIIIAALLLYGCSFNALGVSVSFGATDTPTPTDTPTVTPSPTPTETPTPTDTPTVTPSPTLTPTLDLLAGIEFPVTALDVDFRFFAVEKIAIYTGSDGKKWWANPGYDMVKVSATSQKGAHTVQTWAMDQSTDSVHATLSNGLTVFWVLRDAPTKEGPGIVNWIFTVPTGTSITKIHLPGGVDVDLSPLVKQ